MIDLDDIFSMAAWAFMHELVPIDLQTVQQMEYRVMTARVATPIQRPSPEVVFQWEHDISGEIGPLIKKQYSEVAVNTHAVKLDPDWAQFRKLREDGIMHTYTARHEGDLVGYVVYFVKSHINYKSTLFATGHIFYVDPDYRGEDIGRRLFEGSEAKLREMGVGVVQQHCKLHDGLAIAGDIFESLGYEATDKVYAKVLG